MSTIVYLGPATVKTTSPLTVLMPNATTPQAALTLGGPTPGVDTVVVVVVREDGTTYVLGTPPAATTVTAQDVLVPGLNGSVWRVTVADGVGSLTTTRVS